MASEDAGRTRWPGRWYRIRLTLPRRAEDDVTGLLALAGCEGTATQPAGRGRLAVEAWFTTLERAQDAARRVAAVGDTRLAAPEPEPIEDNGWLAAALAPRGPLAAGRFVVCDRGADQAAAAGVDAVTILLPPGRAFGTGEHATTRMCLELLDELLVPGEPVLDLGTGSGILAIAAARAGAGPVLALDLDPNVIDVAQENLVLNGVAERVTLREGSWIALDRGARFGLVLANIHRTALVRSAPTLAARLLAGGRAILSGFHPQDAPLVRDAWAAQGALLCARRDDGEWSALALQRGS